MSSKNFYITTPIFYVNDVPHIGHAYTSLACDVVARFMRLEGLHVKFLTGTDEHGQKVEASALKAGVAPQEFTDKNSARFRDMMGVLGVSNDDFIRTTEEKHKKSVLAFWKKLEENGAIYLGKYEGWYSVRDEAYYAESELTEDGLAPTGATVEWVEEPSYFFALSKWQDKLLAYYEENPEFIWPNSRRNEVISFVSGGLHDLSVSRSSFKWGIPVPGDPAHVIYVWVDALVNYISALGYPSADGDFADYWPAAAHVVGKDILRFHAVYWPAFLMAAGLELPKSIISHGWWTNDGQKISKSLGNVIDPFGLVDEFGLDQVRYFLMREVNFGNDGNFSKENLVLRSNSELSNKIGNLLQRTSAFVYKNCDAKIPDVDEAYVTEVYETDLFKEILSIVSANAGYMEKFDINKVLSNIIHITEAANIYIDKEAPWALRKTDPEKMKKVLYLLLEVLRYIAIMMQPFTPDSAKKMLDQLNIPEDARMNANLTMEFALSAGASIKEPTPIFPRLER
ncbi:MAG: methionine--tRNA ligase [Rickettsiales bacterium]|nr:MAG: methionine--tRNA ligase [Rickettsiales bacterium]